MIEVRVGVLVNILSGTMSRAGTIEYGINQLINSQFGFLDMPFLPLVEEIANEAPVMAQGAISRIFRICFYCYVNALCEFSMWKE